MAATKKKPMKKQATNVKANITATTSKARPASKQVAQQQPNSLRAFISSNGIALWVFIAIAVPQLTLLWRPIVGAYVTVLSLAALLGLGLRVASARRLAIAAAILPVTMLVALSLPQPDAFTQAGVFYSTILLLVIMCNFSFNFHEPVDFSVLRKRHWMLLPLMVVLGEALGALGYGVLYHTSYVFHGLPTALVAVGALIFAVAEEFLFRGLVQEQAAKVVHPITAAVLATLAYTVIYVPHGSVLPVVFAVLSGAVLSGVYYFKQNLVLTTTLNAVMKLSYLGLLATFVLH